MFGLDLKRASVFGGKNANNDEALEDKEATVEEPEAIQEESGEEAEGDEDGEDDDVDEDDVHKMLEEMEIPEFEISEDELSVEEDCGQFPEESTESGKKPWELVDWTERLKREEIFSKHYRPSSCEKKELNEMASDLGLTPATGVIGRGLRASMAIGMGMANTDNIHNLFYGNHSILLTQGPVMWQEKDCGFVFLTDGFVLTYTNVSGFNPLEKRYETSQLWTDVDFCEKVNALTFAIQLQSGDRYEIDVVKDGDDLKTWLKALERVLIEHAMHRGDPSLTDTLGWQYRLIHKAGFSAAVTGDLEVIGKSKNLNKLDGYNKYAPLHYAVQQENCSIEVVKELLKKGADPNLPDGDGRSPMYYAERNRLTDIQNILEENGGTASKLAEMEERGALFGSAGEANRKTEKRHELEEAVKDQKAAEATAKAETAQAQMNKNMAALNERGEKIENLDQKTQDLEDEAKTFKNLAGKLKDQVKNKKWYQL